MPCHIVPRMRCNAMLHATHAMQCSMQCSMLRCSGLAIRCEYCCMTICGRACRFFMPLLLALRLFIALRSAPCFSAGLCFQHACKHGGSPSVWCFFFDRHENVELSGALGCPSRALLQTEHGVEALQHPLMPMVLRPVSKLGQRPVVLQVVRRHGRRSSRGDVRTDQIRAWHACDGRRGARDGIVLAG